MTSAFAGLFPVNIDRRDAVGVNTQTELFRAGKLVAFFVHSRLPNLRIGRDLRQTNSRVLWPLAGRALNWPPGMRSL